MGKVFEFKIGKKRPELMKKAETEEGLKEMLTFANAAASIITTKKGALKVMPTKADVEEFLANNR